MKPAALAFFAVLIFGLALHAENTWPSKFAIPPEQLLKQLKATKDKQPLLLQVGFDYMFKSNHIPGSKFAGPGKTDEGLALLRKTVEKLPRDKEIVLYCGCCRSEKCPNIPPALKAVQALGFKNVK